MADNVTRKDDTDAFGLTFLTVRLNDPDELLSGHTITKAEIKIGDVLKTFLNPVFPFDVALTASETCKLQAGNAKVYMRIYDENGKRYTPQGSGTVVVGEDKV